MFLRTGTRKKYRTWFLPTSGISSCDISQGKIIAVHWLLCYRFFESPIKSITPPTVGSNMIKLLLVHVSEPPLTVGYMIKLLLVHVSEPPLTVGYMIKLLLVHVSEPPPTVGSNMIKLLFVPVSELPPTVGCRLESAVIGTCLWTATYCWLSSGNSCYLNLFLNCHQLLAIIW